jgi:hypothetical protein
MSWFGTKAEQAVVYASPRNSLDKPQKRSPYSTPHDTILAEIHASPDRVASPESTDINLAITPTPSLHQPSRLSSPDLLIDPFNGTSLGTLLPHSQDSEVQPVPSQTNLSSPETGPSQNANTAVPSEFLWSHLTSILDLQSQISKKHLEMESIGHVDAKSKKHGFSHKSTLSNASTTGIGSGSKRTVPENLSTPPGLNTRERTLSTASSISSSSDPERDEANVDMDVDVPSEEAEKNRVREEEFASLAQQFDGRKEAINDIMGKVCKNYHSRTRVFFQRSHSQLDDLFTVLSDFHSLQGPSLDFPASRQQSQQSPVSPVPTVPTVPAIPIVRLQTESEA